MSAAIRRFQIEAERKFHPSAFSRSSPYLISPGAPSFRRLDYGGTLCFRDVYFDDVNASLMKRSIYIRSRDGRWEAKHGNSGNFVASQFGEIESPVEIASLVRKAIGGSEDISETNNFGLSPVADFTTDRLSLVADDQFTIALDDTDFGHLGHSVGEVELVEDLELRVNESKVAEILTKQNKKAEMGGKIQNFMARYAWAFPTTTADGKPVKGKLTRYFELQSQRSVPLSD